MVVPSGEGNRGGEGGREYWGGYVAMEGQLNLGGEHTIQHTDDALQNCSCET